MDTDQETETEYVFVVGVQCDRVMNTIAGVFTKLQDAKDFESYLNRKLFNTGTSHPNAVFTQIVAFNPKREK